MTLRPKRVEDRRIQKTRKLLRDALASLIREKPYDVISIKEILDRANVGRSTFYTHFRDKDELLVSAVHDMLGPVQSTRQLAATKPWEGIIWFSLPVFEYHHQHRHSRGDRLGARGQAIVHEYLRKVLAESIADEIGRESPSGRRTASPIPRNLLAQYVASTFVLVLNWWLDSRNPLPPREVNDLFRALILPTLTAI